MPWYLKLPYSCIDRFIATAYCFRNYLKPYDDQLSANKSLRLLVNCNGNANSTMANR